jgi:hypothetical protein
VPAARCPQPPQQGPPGAAAGRAPAAWPPVRNTRTWARLCLAGYVAFSEAIARRWLLGGASRKDAQRALTDTLLRLLLEIIPGR